MPSLSFLHKVSSSQQHSPPPHTHTDHTHAASQQAFDGRKRVPWRGFALLVLEHACDICQSYSWSRGFASCGKPCPPHRAVPRKPTRGVAVPCAWGLCYKLRLLHVLKHLWQHLAGRKDLWQPNCRCPRSLCPPRQNGASFHSARATHHDPQLLIPIPSTLPTHSTSTEEERCSAFPWPAPPRG
jgi:hypothetical protein